jgi:hypothetical protein
MTEIKRGRPPIFTQNLSDKICERLACGESLLKICEDEDMPHMTTVLRWQNKDKDFAASIARARELQAEFYAASIIQISDETEVEVKHDGEDVRLELSAAAVARNRLRVDARKWYASKLSPRKFGEKLELSGGLAVKTSPSDLTDEQLAAIAMGGTLPTNDEPKP